MNRSVAKLFYGASLKLLLATSGVTTFSEWSDNFFDLKRTGGRRNRAGTELSLRRGPRLVQRAAAIATLLTALLLACGKVRADNYNVTYTGTGSFALGPQASSSGSGGSASASVSGTVTATFVWSGPSTPPPAVVVMEQCTAGAGGYGYSSPPSPTADDGLSDPQTNSGTGNMLYTSSSGVLYSAQSGSSFSITCSPSASVAGTNGMVQASVTFSAAAYPQTMTFQGGAVINGQQSYLIGQQCVAGLSPGGLNFLRGTTYSWSVPNAGSPFANYGTTSAAIDSSQDAKSVYSTLINLSSSTLTCYFSTGPATANLQCTVTIPFIKGPLSYTITGQVAVVAPSPPKVIVDLGTTQGLPVGGPASAVGPMGAPAVNGIPNTVNNGIVWYGSVVTPQPFAAAGSGNWSVVQLLTSTRTEMQHHDTLYGLFWTLPVPPQMIDGVQGLDNHFPYGSTYMNPGFIYPADGSLNFNGDSPNQDFTQFFDFSGGDSFVDYVMYTPPGNNSIPVPLATFTWSWSANAMYSINNSGNFVWAITGAQQSCTQPVQALGMFPQWNNRYVKSNLSYALAPTP